MNRPVFLRTVVTMLSAVVLLAPVGLDAQPRRAVHYVVGFDRSASRTPQQMRDMDDFMRRLAPSFDYGDAIDYVMMFQSGTDEVVERRDSMPAPKDPARPVKKDELIRTTMRNEFARRSARFTDSSGVRPQSTDILGFLRRAGSYLRSDARRRAVIIILSDMLHSMPGLDFERGAVPNAAWFASQQRAGMLPKLTGVCIVAVGAAEGTPLAARVRQFWMQYATHTGAVLKPEHYQRYLEPSAMDCGG